MPTPNLGLPQLAADQAQKHVTVNEALYDLDALVQLAVLDRSLAVPPGSPADGARTSSPQARGGPTNFGITLTNFRKYIKADATAADVRAMSVDQAKAICRKRYWDVQRCDELPAGVDYSVFDYGVNSGIGRSGKVLRRVVGLPDSASAVTDQVLVYARARDPKVLRRDLR